MDAVITADGTLLTVRARAGAARFRAVDVAAARQRREQLIHERARVAATMPPGPDMDWACLLITNEIKAVQDDIKYCFAGAQIDQKCVQKLIVNKSPAHKEVY